MANVSERRRRQLQLDQNLMDNRHFLDDNRLEHHAVTGQGGLGLGASNGIGGGGGGGGSVGGSSSLGASSHHAAAAAHHHNQAVAAASAALLVVPQPINASKMGGPGGVASGAGGHAAGGGSGRKYQCKMCPQVSASATVSIFIPSGCRWR
ncbi:hypothetical protein M5D96_001353 [Drosophila gunungcola]|uniref:Uncharacterized protein n=1 Tax=Drosophila gunungcola TaxID=103775 RepID=A0A9P9YXZ3_9MUSC|nr:hypothetical protein M5D96_001353 [Drosophila gunungcola]